MSENHTEETAVSGRRQVMQAAGLVGAAFLVSRVVGLGRDIVAKYYLALSVQAAAFDAAQQFPNFIFAVVAGGAIGSAFIPTFSAYFARDDEPGAWRLFSAIVNLTFIVTLLASLFTFIFAPTLTRLFLQESIIDHPELFSLTVRLMRVMLLTPMIFSVSGVIMGTLNARQHFLLPALAPIVYNLGIIAGAVLWPADLGDGKAMGMAVGTVIGACGHLLVQLPGLRWKGARYTPLFTLRDAGVQQVLKLMAPRVLGLSFSYLNPLAMVFLAGRIGPASISAVTLASRVMMMPQGILGQAMGTATFPTLAALAARNALDEMRQILTDSLRTLLFLGLPATALLITLGKPVIAILFERGDFTAADTALVAAALAFYAVGLIALLSLEVVARAFYALNDTATPVLAGAVQIALMFVFGYFLSEWIFPALGWLSLGGLVLGYSNSGFMEVGVLLWLLKRKMGRLNGRFLLDGIWRMGLATLVMGIASWAVVDYFAQSSILLQLILGGLVGAVAYFGLSFVLQVKEIHWLWQTTQRYLQRFI
ncbi:MAG: murein biosynthesis integral membrane protein MurJ [Anaerolineales bacterium]|nr:murein biosynthesis integral membrane protein MurJ [Anaerolineales bacterium]